MVDIDEMNSFYIKVKSKRNRKYLALIDERKKVIACDHCVHHTTYRLPRKSNRTKELLYGTSNAARRRYSIIFRGG